jgi:hypothetical protein
MHNLCTSEETLAETASDKHQVIKESGCGLRNQIYTEDDNFDDCNFYSTTFILYHVADD